MIAPALTGPGSATTFTTVTAPLNASSSKRTIVFFEDAIRPDRSVTIVSAPFSTAEVFGGGGAGGVGVAGGVCAKTLPDHTEIASASVAKCAVKNWVFIESLSKVEPNMQVISRHLSMPSSQPYQRSDLRIRIHCHTKRQV